MAAVDFFDVQALARSMKIVAGQFFPQGAGAIVNASNIGKGFTVVRGGVGAYTVTPTGAGKYPFLIAGLLTLGLGANADQKLIINGYSTPAGGVGIQCLAVAAASEIAASANNQVHFCFLLSNDGAF